MGTKTEDRVIFLCANHRFVIVCSKKTVDCHGSPGLRQTGCESCDKAVDDALGHIGYPR